MFLINFANLRLDLHKGYVHPAVLFQKTEGLSLKWQGLFVRLIGGARCGAQFFEFSGMPEEAATGNF